MKKAKNKKQNPLTKTGLVPRKEDAASAKQSKRATPDSMTVVTMETTKGTIKFSLLPQYAPVHVDKFITLTRKKFYDGVMFHRVVPGFVIQGGDLTGTGTGGPGYNIKAEFSERKHLLGTVAMARASDPNSAGSQFYICLDAQPSLDGQYTTFGQVFEGLDVVEKIVKGDKMTQVTVKEVAYSAVPESARN